MVVSCQWSVVGGFGLAGELGSPADRNHGQQNPDHRSLSLAHIAAD
jgi:hypothetical protein